MQQVLLLELNEVNFPSVVEYIRRGELPFFAHLLSRYRLVETTSETRYEELEPWIQWVTAHTGRALSEHGVFRLGDIVTRDLPQIWEVLERCGLNVGAIAPMNASNRCEHPAFFVPDPWTNTPATGSRLLRGLSDAVAQAVNDNAQARIAPRSAAWLAAGLARYARPRNYGVYAALMRQAARRPWSRAMLLDLLLADVFIRETRRKAPDFASLFVNAAAHIQHHYMFNSAVYEGPLENPSWYVAQDLDPVLEIYRLYDRIVADVAARFPESRLMIATGLHQDPHPEECYYWRLKQHDAFLRSLAIPFERVEPRMSRDFLVRCRSAQEAAAAERMLRSVRAEDGEALFEVDNRGADLFVMLTYPREIDDVVEFRSGSKSMGALRPHVSFVAIKNGQHNGTGYFIDTGMASGADQDTFPLAELPAYIAGAFGLPWTAPQAEPDYGAVESGV